MFLLGERWRRLESIFCGKRMEVTSEIALGPLTGKAGKPESTVLIRGHKTQTTVRGHVLEVAIRCGSDWLLFTSDDVPYEEGLSIYLLDSRGVILDSAHLVQPYGTGIFSDVRLQPPNQVKFNFNFNGRVAWRVVVHSRAKLAIPWLPDQYGVWRSRRCLRRLSVHSC